MTNEHREQAREIAQIQNRANEKYSNVRLGDPLEEPCPGCGCVTFAAARKDVNRLLAALSSRDAEIKEVLEGLVHAGVEFDDERIHYVVMQIDRETLKLARALYAKVGGEASHDREPIPISSGPNDHPGPSSGSG